MALEARRLHEIKSAGRDAEQAKAAAQSLGTSSPHSGSSTSLAAPGEGSQHAGSAVSTIPGASRQGPDTAPLERSSSPAEPEIKKTWTSGWFGGGGGNSDDSSSADRKKQRNRAAWDRELLQAPFNRQRAQDDNLRLSVTICAPLHLQRSSL